MPDTLDPSSPFQHSTPLPSSSLIPLTVGNGSLAAVSSSPSSSLSALHHRLGGLRAHLQQYDKLLIKLETITDEPMWDAFIPFGPLAYFPGQLIQTNDITEHPPFASTSSAPTRESSGPSEPVLRSAKQARASALVKKRALEQDIAALEADISAQQTEIARQHAARAAGASHQDNWSFNERGEVINDEGLPVFDIREELPPEESPTEAPSTSTKGKEKLVDKPPQMRYLIKKGGKQTIRPLNAAPTKPRPQDPNPTSSTRPPTSTANPTASTSRLDTKAILDALEVEERDETTAEPGSPAPHALDTQSSPTPEPTSTPHSASPQSTTPVPVASKVKPKSFLSGKGFSSGFLNPKPRPKAKPAPVLHNLTELIVPSANDTDPDAFSHEPLHHSREPSKSIYRPTPPPSAPGTPIVVGTPRSGSPILSSASKKVAFDLPQGQQQPERENKTRKAAIVLPPPPGSQQGAALETTKAPEKPAAKDKFERPIKDKVVERGVKPPSLPNLAGNRGLRRDRAQNPEVENPTDERPGYVKTMAKPPQVVDFPQRPIATSSATRSTSSASTNGPIPTPIHTVSFGSRKATDEPGTTSISEIFDNADEDGDQIEDEDEDEDDLPSQPSLASDHDSDSSSSGFYGSDDDDDDDFDIDIDAALHQREIALAYHERRQGLRAGAGTGPLGGDRDVASYDSWQQEVVPVEATMQGRQAGGGGVGGSRFRNGRLEATRMIIPDLLAKSIRPDRIEEDSEDDDDGMTAEERERVRIALEKLAKGESLEMFAHEEQARKDKVLPKVEAIKNVMERAPPRVKPVMEPSMPTVAAPKAPTLPDEKPKKMSR
ncbi:BQ2448_6689 [Microbotryum intermedium]|uniref:BQ2448_6689 protein n=1 Tax=Microbotryum intermedium TaxID=269621 RepID=A0A238FLW1_9BASI|nr:BQ2448_6689 [Microbotryum intermedium]